MIWIIAYWKGIELYLSCKGGSEGRAVVVAWKNSDPFSRSVSSSEIICASLSTAWFVSSDGLDSTEGLFWLGDTERKDLHWSQKFLGPICLATLVTRPRHDQTFRDSFARLTMVDFAWLCYCSKIFNHVSVYHDEHRLYFRRLSQTTQTDVLLGNLDLSGSGKVILRPMTVQDRIRELNLQARMFTDTVLAIQTTSNHSPRHLPGHRSLQVGVLFLQRFIANFGELLCSFFECLLKIIKIPVI